MSDPPPRRAILGDLFAECWPNATPEMLAEFINEFGPLDQEVYSLEEILREFEEDIGNE